MLISDVVSIEKLALAGRQMRCCEWQMEVGGVTGALEKRDLSPNIDKRDLEDCSMNGNRGLPFFYDPLFNAFRQAGVEGNGGIDGATGEWRLAA